MNMLSVLHVLHAYEKKNKQIVLVERGTYVYISKCVADHLGEECPPATVPMLSQETVKNALLRRKIEYRTTTHAEALLELLGWE